MTECVISARLDSVIDAAQAATDKELNAWHKCAYCNATFRERDNLGMWKCKQHTMQYNAFSDGFKYRRETWECCGKSQNPGGRLPHGCVPCDHRAVHVPYTTDDVAIVRKASTHRVQLRADTALWDAEKNAYVIHRLNVAEAMKKAM